MSASEEPIATWAFRAALSGLPDEEVREILESDRCPAPEAEEDPTSHIRIDGEGSDLVVYREDSEDAWLQTDTHELLSDVR
jgi:hypothetical protein